MSENNIPDIPSIPNYSGELRAEEPLARHTYFRIGGPAQYLAIPRSEADLSALSEWARQKKLPLFVMGSGSNLLVSDAGFRGLVVKCTRLGAEIERILESQDGKSAIVRTGAGVAISSLLRKSADEGWGGFEIWTGIPGSIGGAVAMNGGTHLGETKDLIVAVEVFDFSLGGRKRIEGSELKFSYRKNHFLTQTAIVLSAEWRVRLDASATVKQIVDETLARRKQSQPVELPSCGSVFKNPAPTSTQKNDHPALKAWQVIDKLGLRAHRIGNAQFSPKHSNFIVNLGGATAADVRALIDLARARAHAELGVELEPEVVMLGF